MTTSLTVFTKSGTLANTYEVFWACGWKTQGTVSVSIACQVDVPEIAAELGVLRHLLEDREVCGSDRTGNSMKLTCSFGAVKKLARGKSAKASLAPFALFLRTRFADAEIIVSKDTGFINHPRAQNHHENLVVTGPVVSTLTLPDKLAVGITQHALETYMVRYQNLVAANAWRALRAAIEHPGTRLQHSTQDDLGRHGKGIRTYVTSGGLRLIVAMESAGSKLLTCYYSHSALRYARIDGAAVKRSALNPRHVFTGQRQWLNCAESSTKGAA